MTVLEKPRSLTIHVAVAFAVLFAVLASALIGFSTLSSRALVLDAARKLKESGVEFPLQLNAGVAMGEATTMQGYWMALLGTGERPLVHVTRRDSRTIPGIVMADIWMKVRRGLVKRIALDEAMAESEETDESAQ